MEHARGVVDQPVSQPRVATDSSVKLIFRNLKADLDVVKFQLIPEPKKLQTNPVDSTIIDLSPGVKENPAQKFESFKKARKRRLTKIQKKRVLKKKRVGGFC